MVGVNVGVGVLVGEGVNVNVEVAVGVSVDAAVGVGLGDGADNPPHAVSRKPRQTTGSSAKGCNNLSAMFLFDPV